MKITIKTIPHSRQRYPTIGDWVINKNGDITIMVSDTKNDHYTFLVGVHELVEAYLCKVRGITQQMVDNFDMNSTSTEPGELLGAPYYQEHKMATHIEAELADELQVDWNKYDKALTKLWKTKR